MEVKLTDAGRKHFQKSGDVNYVTVSIDRAVAMMKSGLAAKDETFITLYERNNPEPKPVEQKAEPTLEPEIESDRPEKRGRKKKKEKRYEAI